VTVQPPDRRELRRSDADRERAIQRRRQAVAQGRLSMSEFVPGTPQPVSGSMELPLLHAAPWLGQPGRHRISRLDDSPKGSARAGARLTAGPVVQADRAWILLRLAYRRAMSGHPGGPEVNQAALGH
jgi:hypothetical protein